MSPTASTSGESLLARPSCFIQPNFCATAPHTGTDGISLLYLACLDAAYVSFAREREGLITFFPAISGLLRCVGGQSKAPINYLSGMAACWRRWEAANGNPALADLYIDTMDALDAINDNAIYFIEVSAPRLQGNPAHSLPPCAAHAALC